MTEDRKRTMKVGTKIGAALGAIVFLIFGLVPGFYFGSYGALVLMSRLAGGPVEPTTIVRMGFPSRPPHLYGCGRFLHLDHPGGHSQAHSLILPRFAAPRNTPVPERSPRR